MKRLRIIAALLALGLSSYAQAAEPEGGIGSPIPALSGTASGKPSAGALRAAGGVDRNAAAYGRALSRLQPEGRAATRGAVESRIYQQASPAVVLVIAGDSFGSGVLVGADGRIVTNLHVVGDAKEVGVIFKPATEGAAVAKKDVRIAKVIRRDGVADLALIQVSEAPVGVAPLKIAGASAIQVGSDVHAIGHPTGEAWTYTKGVVSQIRRDYAWAPDNGFEHRATVIQTQTPINPGNSGGPLLDDKLQVVGINSFTGEGEGLNFAVSGEDVATLLAMKEDRAAVPSTACETKTLSSGRSKKPKGEEFLLDTDCDGKGDTLMNVPFDRREPITYVADTDGDGRFDAVLIDDGQDDQLDLALYDTDKDGEPDLEGYYRPGENEPYRYEKITPKKKK